LRLEQRRKKQQQQQRASSAPTIRSAFGGPLSVLLLLVAIVAAVIILWRKWRVLAQSRLAWNDTPIGNAPLGWSVLPLPYCLVRRVNPNLSKLDLAREGTQDSGFR